MSDLEKWPVHIPPPSRLVTDSTFNTSLSGAPQSYALPYSPGGSQAQTVHYMAEVTAISGPNVRVSIELKHADAGQPPTLHSVAIPTTNVSTPPPTLLVGQAGPPPFKDNLHPVIVVSTTDMSGEAWVTLRLCELRDWV